MSTEAILAGALHTQAYRRVVQRLVELRNAAGLSQAALAQRLGKPPSFVAKYELCERRLDLVETVLVLRELSTTPEEEVMRLAQVIPAPA